MNSGKIFQTSKIFTAFSLSLLAPCLVLIGRDCLPVLHCGRIGYISSKPERRTSNLALKMFQQLHISLYIYFCKKILYPRSTISAMVCQDSHVKYIVFIERMNKQLLLARDCCIFVARLLPYDFYLHIYSYIYIYNIFKSIDQT